jgi:hypothetical protein
MIRNVDRFGAVCEWAGCGNRAALKLSWPIVDDRHLESGAPPSRLLPGEAIWVRICTACAALMLKVGRAEGPVFLKRWAGPPLGMFGPEGCAWPGHPHHTRLMAETRRRRAPGEPRHFNLRCSDVPLVDPGPEDPDFEKLQKPFDPDKPGPLGGS